MINTKNIFAIVALSSVSLFAGPVSDKADLMITQAQRVKDLAIQMEYSASSRRQKLRMKKTLEMLINNAKDIQASLGIQSTPVTAPTVPTRPVTAPPVVTPVPPAVTPLPPVVVNTFKYTAKCHVDDDSMLDFDQTVIDIEARTVSELLDECELMAKSVIYAGSYSFGLDQISTRGTIPAQMQSAVCHIDDDSMFDDNQFVPGTLYAPTISQLISECETIAQSTFGGMSSSALRQINTAGAPVGFTVSATCHIDDDTMMDFGQYVAGEIYGQTIEEVSKTCNELAVSNFGSMSSSGLKNVQRLHVRY